MEHNKIENTLTDIQKVIKEIQKSQEEMKKSQEEMQKDQEEMRKDIAKIQETQDKMQDELTRLGDTVTVIEVEHGRKIDIMLDVLTGHTEKLEEYEQRFKKDEKIIEMHSHRIYALEAKK